MGAGALGAEAKALGVAVDVFTVGDLFPKPSKETIDGWEAKLRHSAKANPENPLFALRPASRAQAYSETGGLPTLREAIAQGFTRDTGIPVTAAEVRVGNGGKGALTGTFEHLAAREDVTVLVAAPGWPTNYDMFPYPVRILEVDTQGRGLMSPEQLTQALQQHPNPAVILVNAPSNPTGANYSPAEREALLDVVQQHTQTTLVVFDDPYGKLVFDREPYDIATVLARGPIERALFDSGRIATLRTASKEYGMAGSRVGWLVTKNKTLLESLQNYNESRGGAMATDSQLRVQAALMYGDDFIRDTVAALQRKRALVVEGISALRFASLTAPQGTIYAWIDFAKLRGKFVPKAAMLQAVFEKKLTPDEQAQGGFEIATPADMMRYLVFVAGVNPVQGTPFFAPGSPAGAEDWHVRMSICNDTEELQRGIEKMQRTEAQLLEHAPAKAA